MKILLTIIIFFDPNNEIYGTPCKRFQGIFSKTSLYEYFNKKKFNHACLKSFTFAVKSINMKRIIILLQLSIIYFSGVGQNYQIGFAGTGASTSVDSVRLINLTQCTSVRVLGNDILNLVGIVGINHADQESGKSVSIYPNPMEETSILQFICNNESPIKISVVDLTGKVIITSEKKLAAGLHKFRIDGLSAGSYLINIVSEDYSYTGDLLSVSKSKGNTAINYVSSDTNYETLFHNKKILTTVPMQYNAGERLLFIGYSGNYITMSTHIATANTTISINFVSATDADNNHYPVVQIGTQKWFGKNLTTSKFNDGSSITQVQTNTTWNTLSTPAYCIYANNATYHTLYGKLYNWFAVDAASNGNKNVCPIGWHVPTETDWNTLLTYLGGETIAGGKMKSICASTWAAPNTGATNETGFTALPGGYRDATGPFDFAGLYAQFWAATSYDGGTAWMYMLSNNDALLGPVQDYKKAGNSVRCIKD